MYNHITIKDSSFQHSLSERISVVQVDNRKVVMLSFCNSIFTINNTSITVYKEHVSRWATQTIFTVYKCFFFSVFHAVMLNLYLTINTYSLLIHIIFIHNYCPYTIVKK